MLTRTLFGGIIFVLFIAIAGCGNKERPEYAIVVHGGAGAISKNNMTPEQERAYREGILNALKTAEAVLTKGGVGLDAIVAAIMTMEDSPLFNAGKGAVFTNQGKNEMDASIMNGADHRAGAVAGVTRIKNPIALARKVMEKSKHVLLMGPGAEAFAAEQGIEFVDPSYFYTETRWKDLEKAKAKESKQKSGEHGTVGVVVLDKYGNIAAGTSTGGLTNKKFGRVGDSPIIGAGTYADNNTCGVSATGQGEYFIRATVAKDISALMEYKGYSVQQAADLVIQQKLKAMGGEGGVIALDRRGNIAMSFNTKGMYRGYLVKGKEPVIQIYN